MTGLSPTGPSTRTPINTWAWLRKRCQSPLTGNPAQNELERMLCDYGLSFEPLLGPSDADGGPGSLSSAYFSRLVADLNSVSALPNFRGVTLGVPVIADMNHDGHADVVLGENDHFASLRIGLRYLEAAQDAAEGRAVACRGRTDSPCTRRRRTPEKWRGLGRGDTGIFTAALRA